MVGSKDNKSEIPLTAHEQVITINSLFMSLSDRISSHKKEHDDRFDKLQACIERIENVLIPRDGTKSIPEEIRKLEDETESLRTKNKEEEATKIWVVRLAISSFVAMILTFMGLVGKAIISLFRIPVGQ